jgi:zinc transporter ZupT
MILLSVHSLIEGAALGIGFSLMSIVILFIAIVSHKGAESFSLTIEMQKKMMPPKIALNLLLIFACMTPFGILFGSVLNSYLQASSVFLAESIFDAVAAGTFFYIALMPHSDVCEKHADAFSLDNLWYFGLGIALMAFVAIWA